MTVNLHNTSFFCSSIIVILYGILFSSAFSACSNSEPVGFGSEATAAVHSKDANTIVSEPQIEPTKTDSIRTDSSRIESLKFNEETASIDTSSDINSIETHEVICDTIQNNLPLDDSEYPYADLPRIVIETENLREIKDRETEIPAKLQIWGKNAPESEVMELTIRGRGNTSWTDMPKKSYKIEFIDKQAILGMPKDRDWALIANYADKTLMRNYLMYQLAKGLNSYYAPHCQFVELYLNKNYVGIYLLVETIKVASQRVNIPKDDFSYIIEVDEKHQSTEQTVSSDILGINKTFRIHFPKNASRTSLKTAQSHIQNFETFLKEIKANANNNLDEWIDVDEFVKYYWIQEFAKNPDTGIFERFYTSVYFSLTNDGIIKMGPVWDFDLALGNYVYKESVNSVENWYIRCDWYSYLFKDEFFQNRIKQYWVTNRTIFNTVLDSVDLYKIKLSNASKNNFKRWPILKSTEQLLYKPYSSYEDAVDDLKEWMRQRILWIDRAFSN